MRAYAFVLAGLALASPMAAGGEPSRIVPVGDVSRVERLEQGANLVCADGSVVQLSVLAEDLIRVRTVFSGQGAPLDHSWAVDKTKWNPVAWALDSDSSTVTLSTAELEVVVRRSPLLVTFRDAHTHRVINSDEEPEGRDGVTGEVVAWKRLGLDEHFYGLGEKAARLDRRRGSFQMWNSDTPGYVLGQDPIYQSIPFYIGLEEGQAYGLFYDNSFRSSFDLGHSGQDFAGFRAAGGLLDYYFFYGPSIKKVLGRYTELTGRMPMPPLWALGNQQCRYSYYPDSMVEKIAQTYRAHDLPLDVLYLDIHYMDGYRVFTWDPKRFPDPKGLTRRLQASGVKVVTIVDPGVKYQPHGPETVSPVRDNPALGSHADDYYVYDEGISHDYFLRRKDGSLYIGEVWPGKALFVDYTREDARRWWGGLFTALVDQGVAGIWTDMNEPSDFVDKSGESQKDVVFDDLGQKSLYGKNRNSFALNMARATYEGLERLRPDLRPFVITRAGYAGVQRYSTMWIGDSVASFDSLAMNIAMFASLGLSGESFVGSDLPGFVGRGDGELLARSYQVAFLVPLCRNHGAIDDYDHEPWRYGAGYEAIVRKYLKLRYQLMPYLYTTLEEAHRTGIPLFRPLLINFQDDPSTLNLDDEFMVGDALLAAPVVTAGARSREVYLPSALFYDFWSGSPVQGKGELMPVAVPLDHIPLYVRGGSVIASTVPMNHVGEKPWSPLRFDVYPDAKGSARGSLYEDDGVSPGYKTGAYRRTLVGLETGPGLRTIDIAAPEGSFSTPKRSWEVVLHSSPRPSSVRVDGAEVRPLSDSKAGLGWSASSPDTVLVRLEDDGRAHRIELR